MENLINQINQPDDLQNLLGEGVGDDSARRSGRRLFKRSPTTAAIWPPIWRGGIDRCPARVFHAPQDKIVWDVGHQAYTHKILTGRREQIDTIRTRGGLCGYPNRAESPYDPFNAGHASTAISAAYGMAVAKKVRHEPGHGSRSSGTVL